MAGLIVAGQVISGEALMGGTDITTGDTVIAGMTPIIDEGILLTLGIIELIIIIGEG
jgi:hypothetical protein